MHSFELAERRGEFPFYIDHKHCKQQKLKLRIRETKFCKREGEREREREKILGKMILVREVMNYRYKAIPRVTFKKAIFP